MGEERGAGRRRFRARFLRPRGGDCGRDESGGDEGDDCHVDDNKSDVEGEPRIALEGEWIGAWPA